MRLIDADKLVSELLGEWVEDFDRVGESEMVSATEQIAEYIKSLEAVDAEPVVRCEDCDTEPCYYYTAVDWCSRGHRRENEKR